MNKLFTKIAAVVLGATMAVGVGVAVASSGKTAEPAHAAEVSDTITASDLAATGTSYADFSNVNITSSAKYAGNSAKSSAGAIQMRSKNSNSGIVSTTSGGTVKSVTITVQSGSNTIDVYGSNTAYNAASDLYATGSGGNQGTKVGSVTSTGTITFTDSYTYVGIRSNSGAIYVNSIVITWDAGGGGDTPTDSVSLSVNPSSLELDLNGTTSKTFDVSISSTGSYGTEFTVESDDTSVATVSPNDGDGNDTITVTAAGEGSCTITVTAVDDESATATVGVTVTDSSSSGGGSGSYAKVTSEPADWSGKYLLVYENDTTAYVWTGVDAGHCHADTTISNGTIDKPTGAQEIVIASMTGGYSIKVTGGTNANKYVGRTSNSNGIDFSTTEIVNTLSVSSGDVTIASTSGPTMRFNSSSGDNNDRFRYYKTGQQAVQLYKFAEEEKTVVSSRMVNGTVSAKTGDSKWTVTGFKFFVTYQGESEETEVTSSTTFNVAQSVPTINADGTMSVTVTPTFKGTAYTEKASSVTATLTFIDPYSIARLYDIELALNGTKSDITCDGIYMGYITHVSSGITYYDLFIGNGDYGIQVYGTSTNPSSYTVGETYLTVTGTLKNHYYLYEMTESTVTVLDDATRKSHITAPSTYVVDGTESASTLYLASRKTSLSGTIYSIGGNTTAGTTAEASKNNQIYVTVGGNNVLLYVKSAQATSDVAAKFVVGDSITVEGFTTYYNNSGATFEVLFEKVVEAEEDYHASDFARELLKNTKSYCNSSYDEVTNQKTVLTAVWTALASDGWLKVQAAGEASTLVNGTPDSTIVVPEGADATATDALIDAMTDADAIAAALYRYDYCTAKYSLTNFMSRSLTISFSSGLRPFDQLAGDSANMVAIVAIVSIIGVPAIGGYFFLRKRKETN